MMMIRGRYAQKKRFNYQPDTKMTFSLCVFLCERLSDRLFFLEKGPCNDAVKAKTTPKIARSYYYSPLPSLLMHSFFKQTCGHGRIC